MYRLAWSVVVLLASASVATADGVAGLFPADTLVYAEVREPAKVGPQVTAALAGSPLEDVVKFIDKRRDKAKTPNDITGKSQLAVLGLLASPELAAEFGKLGGAAAGLTGFDANGQPEVAVAVLTGDSAAAGLAARAFLSLAPVRRVAAVDGVPVYQFRTPQFTFDPMTGEQKFNNDKPPAEGAYEATAAYTPGLFVYGTSKAAVGAVLTRFRGNGAGGLGGVAAFQAARVANPHPGLFVYANAAALVEKLDDAGRAGVGEPGNDLLGWYRLLANDKAVRTVAGTIRFRDGGVVAELTAAFAPGQASPLLTILSGPGAKAEHLGHAASAAPYAVTLALPEKGRTAAVIGILDPAAKASGDLGRTPSEALKELEAKFKTPVADGLIGKTRAVTVFAPPRAATGKGAAALPTIVLHTDSAEVSAAWEDFLPKLAADVAGGEPLQPSSETIDGVKVLSLPGADLPWKAAVHYARKDAVIAVGLDRAGVAAAVAGGASAVPLAADNPAALAGFLRLGGVGRGFAAATQPTGPIVPVTPPPQPVRPGFQRFPGDFEPSGSVGEMQQKLEGKALDGLWTALDTLPVAVVTARRVGAELRIEVVQTVGKDGFAGVVAAGVGWFDVYLNRTQNPNYPPGVGGFRRFR